MKVLKFGGSSVANASTINKVISIVKENAYNQKVWVVVSAFGGVTDLLIEASTEACNGNSKYRELFSSIEKRHVEVTRELIPAQYQGTVLSEVKKELNQLESLLEGIFLLNELSPKTSDKIMSFGELLSSFIIAEAMKNKGFDVAYKNSKELIVTDTNFNRAGVFFEQTTKNIVGFFKSNQNEIIVSPGFIAMTKGNETSTLGRGGSDYTAAIYAAAIDASVLEIWTDVSGMFTANPKLVKQAFPIKSISYEEAMELSHFGAKVLYPPTIQPVLSKEIPICIKNTFDAKSDGTLITKSAENHYPIKGLSHIDHMALCTLEGSGMIGVPGISMRLFKSLSEVQINIALITQASSEHSICFAINDSDSNLAKAVVEKEFEYEISKGAVNPLEIELDQAIIALVGDKMKSHQGISGKMFSTLGKNNVNIRAIAQGASEMNISAVIAKKDVEKALNTLHSSFFEDQTKQLNLFVVGVGNVGGKLLDQIRLQQHYLLEELNLQIRVIALTNSKQMLFNDEGIDLDVWKSELLQKGEKLNIEGFKQKVKELNMRNSIFVDNTANEEISDLYEFFLKESVSVVTCNKIACSSELSHYKKLKQLAKEYSASFLYETNVGAGLPIIDTLKNLVASGDKVTKIQAVLSGSLNFIFNNLSPEKPFFEVVQQAGIEGYTEPDPRIDLSGVDVMRKILILARESGYEMELDDIQNQTFLPEASLKADSVSDFMETLKDEKLFFDTLHHNAAVKDCRLKYVASFNNGKAEVGLQEIAKDHPFYNLDGKDNIVLFYTKRYIEQPLIIKGAGAGAEVTASGLFADIIRISTK